MSPIELTGHVLLFTLVLGMSATVDISCMIKQLRNIKALMNGLFLQFVVLPFLGFCSVKWFGLGSGVGLMLLVVTSSPGGSFSNWWCSLFNADLALSVTMTAISTILSTVMLPLNLLLYTSFAFGHDSDDVIQMIDFTALFVSLAVLGSVAGVALVLLSAIASNTNENSSPLWSKSWQFYLGVASPCVIALFISNAVTTWSGLKKPERVTSAIECCYQNCGIATSVALAMFQGDDLAEALSVPLFYGIVEFVVIGSYCLTAWKIGWTKAPPQEPFWRVITCAYEVVVAEQLEKNHMTIEVQLSSNLEAELNQEEQSFDDEGSVEHCMYYCHDPCGACTGGDGIFPDLELKASSASSNPVESIHTKKKRMHKKKLEEKLREKRGPKQESQYHITLATEFLKSLGYKIKE
eukprot:scaffold693_cov200-Alexandrium_tamarense.AAC.90